MHERASSLRKADKADIPLEKMQYSDGRHKIQIGKDYSPGESLA